MKLQQWAHLAEIGASVGVIVTLLLLLQEVRGNTAAIERQASLDRTTAWTAPFFPSSDLPDILAKIKAVDGVEPANRRLLTATTSLRKRASSGSGTYLAFGRAWRPSISMTDRPKLLGSRSRVSWQLPTTNCFGNTLWASLPPSSCGMWRASDSWAGSGHPFLAMTVIALGLDKDGSTPPEQISSPLSSISDPGRSA